MMNRLVVLINLIPILVAVHSTRKSSCSPYLIVETVDHRTNDQYVAPCPAPKPCRCLCMLETKRLWIDCFHRQLTELPILQQIPTNRTSVQWNIDLAFNRFEMLTQSPQASWLPNNMHVQHLILSNSLVYDLIVQLNLTHRNLIDQWSSDHSLLIGDDPFQEMTISHDHEPTRLLAAKNFEFKQQSLSIQYFNLSLAGPTTSSVSILYLDHNLLDSIPIDALYNATALYELYLSFNRIVVLPAYAFGFSHRLTRLDLSHNQIESIDNCTFHRHPDAFAGPFLIDYLDLSYNHLTYIPQDLFSYLVNLRLLKLQHNRIHSLSAHSWTGLYRLKYLDLSHNLIRNLSQTFYSNYLNELNHLKMTSNQIDRIESCEFLSMKALTKLDLSHNQLGSLDHCAFYGVQRTSKSIACHIHLVSNRFESIHPCTFTNFARSTIHLDNNPLVCNCSFNYLLQDQQSLAYTGNECRGGYSYEPQTQFVQPAVRKFKPKSTKKFKNNSKTCRPTFKYYKHVCGLLDCATVCSTHERLIIQITTIATPNGTQTIFKERFISYFCLFIDSLFFFHVLHDDDDDDDENKNEE